MPHTHARERNSVQPARSSTSIVSAGPVSPRGRGRIRMRNAADTTKVAASSANAQPAPTPSTSAVASAGPANSATVCTTDVAALASCSIGSGTVCGTRPVNAGRKNASAAPNTASITTMCQISTAPVKINAASSACIVARIRSVATITRWRGSRSAHTPPSSRQPTNGIACAASTIPTSVGVPISVT